MKIVFTKNTKADFDYWKKKKAPQFKKIKTLILDIVKHPFTGIGKPEPLKYDYAGFWSRRIDRVNRLVYEIEKGKIIVISCKYHY
ncbi:MAG: Txe/YoeB family addiction module toxin [Candidatus Peribacteraceae bacterium]|nr:Txe/YoeB family addiction module toxin [Candidatus Peribacteraceae bacterium]